MTTENLPYSNQTESAVSFLAKGATIPVTSVAQVDLHAISAGPRWRGCHLEIGVATGWDGDDIMVNGHFISLNTNDEVQHLLVRDEKLAEWVPYARMPGALWIHPEGFPFSLRVNGYSKWTAAVIDGKYLDAVMGGHYELNANVNVMDPVIEHLFRALIAELLQPSPNGDVTQSLVRGFVHALGDRQGRKAQELAKAGLSEAKLASLLDWMNARLDDRLTVGAIAAHAGLSAAHFSREFKRSTGRTPWEHVLELRLERARKMLVEGENISSVAQLCGFFDQAHLSRLFKQRYLTSPSAYAKQVLSSK